MPSNYQERLKGLRDFEGVVASFVISTEGEILAADIPAYLDLQALMEASPRLLRMFEAWSVEVPGAECMVRFSEQRLCLFGFEGLVVCVLLSGAVQLPALRRAARILCGAEPGRGGGEGVSVPPSVGDCFLSSEPSPEHTGVRTGMRGPRHARSKSRRVRVYRGQRFEF